MEQESLTSLDRKIYAASGNLDTVEGQKLFDSLVEERRERTFPFVKVFAARLDRIKKRQEEFKGLCREIDYYIEKRRRREERWARIFKFFGLR
jgi:hypothetical protein